jgi:hypothetical protein
VLPGAPLQEIVRVAPGSPEVAVRQYRYPYSSMVALSVTAGLVPEPGVGSVQAPPPLIVTAGGVRVTEKMLNASTITSPTSTPDGMVIVKLVAELALPVAPVLGLIAMLHYRLPRRYAAVTHSTPPGRYLPF